MIKYILFFLFTLLLCIHIGSAQETKPQKEKNQTQVKGDGEINYPKKILVNPDFDFKLKSTSKGKFILSFFKKQNKAITIKIYDITGNLVLQETVSEDGSFSKEYDLSYYKPKFFVVEVGSSQYNKTKSIITE
ncbi:hypothetical protein JKA74_16560 [Marivirga sp. S37H4]|uniref:Secretion system C-terminal sorting domain-containing protein n=1 Tax=Marivirga aurantiaca TaxID=2802615 RepID=A0A934X1M4_9BACT|nr:hypothetical protein [Marivirga aurantiaca]MBK6266660.1 hypothetical protein [Marivirga aurantiaca]